MALYFRRLLSSSVDLLFVAWHPNALRDESQIEHKGYDNVLSGLPYRIPQRQRYMIMKHLWYDVYLKNKPSYCCLDITNPVCAVPRLNLSLYFEKPRLAAWSRIAVLLCLYEIKVNTVRPIWHTKEVLPTKAVHVLKCEFWKLPPGVEGNLKLNKQSRMTDTGGTSVL
jgi:hypothetical protein